MLKKYSFLVFLLLAMTCTQEKILLFGGRINYQPGDKLFQDRVASCERVRRLDTGTTKAVISDQQIKIPSRPVRTDNRYLRLDVLP